MSYTKVVRKVPSFKDANATDLRKNVHFYIDSYKDILNKILQQDKITYDSLNQPFEELNDFYQAKIQPAGHLESTLGEDDLRKAEEELIPVKTKFSMWVSQNEDLYKAIKSIYESPEFKDLSVEKQRAIEKDIKDYRLSGIDLNVEDRAEFSKLVERNSLLMQKFSNNLVDATKEWEYVTTDINELAGLPQSAIDLAIQSAKLKGKEGYRFTIEGPSYGPVFSYADNRNLRKIVYNALTTLATIEGPHNPKYDNTANISEILQNRIKIAKLLKFNNHAEKSLYKKMAETPEQVLNFLNDLVERCIEPSKKERQDIIDLAAKDGVIDLEPYDVAYYATKLQKQLFDFDPEELRPYFPDYKVQDGLFKVVGKLFGITYKENSDVEVYHPDVKYFDIYDADNNLIAGIFFDLYVREGKVSGAWMDIATDRSVNKDNILTLPVVYCTCNFNPPVNGKPALFTHDEVLTLFHETGHCLHHILTKVTVPSVSMNNVEWDAVELPSQMMENWCYQPEALEILSSHYETNEPLPKDLLNKLIASKNFNAGLGLLRQLELSIFDLYLHTLTDDNIDVNKVWDDVRKKVSGRILKKLSVSRVPQSFGHIFAGGYSAGYYSYIWAEVFSSDSFARFEEEGIFNQEVGEDFVKYILSVGSINSSLDNFKKFRGRDASIDPLLRHRGLSK